MSIYHNDRDDHRPLFYTVINGYQSAMSTGNVERIINKYAEIIRPDHPTLPEKVHPHMFRRTRATGLYQNGVEMELVSRILGHASTQTTRIYATPSMEMLKAAMVNDNVDAPETEEWLEDEEDLARLCGLR
jgi:integrase/recombinase XerD